jgi:tellurite resistance protein TerC
MIMFVWIGFVALILALLALDLGVLNRGNHVIGTAEALRWTLFWIGLALAFDGLIYLMYEHHWLGIGIDLGHPVSGWDSAIDYLTGFIIEKSLSLDNIFVISLIFTYFKVPLEYQHRVLFWGILGALGMRGLMIGAGSALIQSFAWTIYAFGGFLLFTAVRMLVGKQDEPDLEKNLVVRMARRLFPLTADLDGCKFFSRRDGGSLKATPLFLVLLIVESSDVLFAVDSIPAIFAVTLDPFIVFTSNIFAILGLRSLYFILASLLDKLVYLKQAIVAILAYVGVKMILTHHLPIPSWISLVVITATLGAGVVASLIHRRRERR